MKPYYDQGGITIYHGETLDVLKALPADSCQGLITDPPYSSGGAFRADRMQGTSNKYVQSGTIKSYSDFQGDNRDQRSFEYWCALWLAQSLRICTSGAPGCVFTDWRQLPITTDAFQAGGWLWRGIYVWDKTAACRPAFRRFSQQCEFVVWGSRGPMAEPEGVDSLPGLGRVAVRSEEKFHMSGKPIEIMTRIVSIVPPGATLLDPFMGSGSTLRAAKDLGRQAVGIEIEEAYCELAARRLEQEVFDFGETQ